MLTTNELPDPDPEPDADAKPVSPYAPLSDSHHAWNPGDDGFDFIAQEILKGWRETFTKSRPINIILAGRPGVGKSTLVNTIFGRKLATTGVGAPVTDTVERHTDPDLPVSIYDTPGIELDAGSVEKVAARFLETIDQNRADPDRRIHFALYCVGVGDSRFQPFEQELVETLCREVTVAVVITKARSPRSRQALALREYIDGLHMPILGGRSFMTLAQPFEPDDDGDPVKPAFGMAELVDCLAENLGEAERLSFARYQQVSLELKYRQAQAVIAVTATTAAGIAFTPIPILDAIPIAAAQLGMMARITTLMGLKVDPKALAGAVAGLVGVSQVARIGVSLLKVFLPVVGNSINATAAAAITTSLGNAYLKACKRIAERQIAGERMSDSQLSEELIADFKRLFKQ